MLTFLATFASSILSPATQILSTEFSVSSEVSILATALYVLGFAFGPTVFGPASEVLGRKNPLSAGMFMFAIFTVPVAVAQNTATIFTCRFLSGVFASAPLAIVSLEYLTSMRRKLTRTSRQEAGSLIFMILSLEESRSLDSRARLFWVLYLDQLVGYIGAGGI